MRLLRLNLALWCRGCLALLRPSLLRFLRYRRSLLRRSHARLLPARRRNWPFRSCALLLLFLNLVTAFRRIRRGLFGPGC